MYGSSPSIFDPQQKKSCESDTHSISSFRSKAYAAAFIGFRDSEQQPSGSKDLDREAGEIDDGNVDERSSRRSGGRDSERYREKSSRDGRRGRSRSRSPRRSRSRTRSRSRSRDRSRHHGSSSSRRSHRDRDDREHGHSSRSSRRESERRKSPSRGADSSSGGGGLRDMNMDETNRMRIQLGLAPLVDDVDDAPAQPHHDAMDVDEAPVRSSTQSASGADDVDISTLSVEERILYLKQKRMEKAKQKKLKTLADDDDDDVVDDPMAWIKRSKQLEEERKKAAKKARELFGDDDEEAEAASTSAGKTADPTGLKVAHDVTDFKEGETVILTLKDQQILDKGRLADADDELEATQLVDDEKARKFREAKQKKSRYVSYDDETDPRNAGGVLSKYDEDKQKSGFVIGAPDASSSSKKVTTETDEDRVASIRRKLTSDPSDSSSHRPAVKAPSLLDDFALPAPVASDYYNVEEAAAVKADEEAMEKKRQKKEKRQKKRKLRSREAESDVFASLAPLGNEDAEAELGSRSERQARARQRELDQMRENAAKMRKFDQAVESANNAVDTAWFTKNGSDSSSGAKVVRDDEEHEEIEYLKRLQQTREAEVERERADRLKSDQDIVNQVAEAVKRRQASMDTEDSIKLEDMEIDQDNGGIVFTATDEFIRGIRNVPDIKEEPEMEEEPPVIRPPPAKRIKKEEVPEDDADDMELDEEFVGAGSAASGASGAASHDDDDEEDEEEGVDGIMGPARVDNKGIAGFLSKLRSEGAASLEDYTSSVAGRVSDKRRGIDAIPEESALDDEDDPNVIKDPNYKFTFKLEYRDKQGRLQTKKEAWRELGQSFHNKAPGKKKLEQRLKREKEEIARKKKLTSDQALQSVQRLQKIQQKTQSAYVVVTSNTQAILAKREGEKFKNIEIDEIPLKKPANAGQRKPAAAAASGGPPAPAAQAPKAPTKIQIQLPQKK